MIELDKIREARINILALNPTYGYYLMLHQLKLIADSQFDICIKDNNILVNMHYLRKISQKQLTQDLISELVKYLYNDINDSTLSFFFSSSEDLTTIFPNAKFKQQQKPVNTTLTSLEDLAAGKFTEWVDYRYVIHNFDIYPKLNSAVNIFKFLITNINHFNSLNNDDSIKRFNAFNWLYYFSRLPKDWFATFISLLILSLSSQYSSFEKDNSYAFVKSLLPVQTLSKDLVNIVNFILYIYSRNIAK